jgi:hypothetical protein
VAVAGGLGLLAAAWAGGQLRFGLVLLAIMLTFAVAVVAASRGSETVAGLLYRRDERISNIDLNATAAAGLVVIVAVVIGAVVELAHHHSGAPYTWLGALAGLTYVVTVVIGRLRR